MAWQDYTNYLMPIEAASQMGMIPAPYIFFIQSKTKDDRNHYLFYVGFGHSFDPQDSKYEILRHYWHEFLKITGKINCLTVNEGGIRPITASEEDAIVRGGEMMWLSHKANEASIPSDSFEPSLEDELKGLLTQFSKEEIILFFAVRQAGQYCRLTEKPDFQSYIQTTLDDYRQKTGWEDIDFSYDNVVKLYSKHLSGNFEDGITIENYFVDLCGPYRTGAITNKISRLDNLIRDSYIVEQIKKSWDEGKNLFIVYGRHHAVVQEPALRFLLQ